MPFQVLSLRVLATRVVVRERMDYKEHLAGNTKRELDDLDMLAGKFHIKEVDVVVEKLNEEGKEVPEEMWKSILSRRMRNFLEEKEEFLIEELEGKRRSWVIEDDTYFPFFTAGQVEEHSYSSDCTCKSVHSDCYIEDGKLMLLKKNFRPVQDKMILLSEHLDSFSLDFGNNVVRMIVFKDFTFGSMVKVTKKMRTERAPSGEHDDGSWWPISTTAA